MNDFNWPLAVFVIIFGIIAGLWILFEPII